MPNSDIKKQSDFGIENLAIAGDGVNELAIEKSEGSGTDQEQMDDMPSAYVTFKKKDTGQSLGTYLISKWWSVWWIPGLEQPQQVSVDGKIYEVFLRSKRTYKPYSIHLIEFPHDRYLCTTTPTNFSTPLQ